MGCGSARTGDGNAVYEHNVLYEDGWNPFFPSGSFGAGYQGVTHDVAAKVEPDPTDGMVDLVEESFDLAVRNMPVPGSALIARRVATYRFVVCGAPGYLAAHGTPRQPADLVDHNCLIFSRSVWGNEWHFAGPDGEQSIAVSGNFHANSDNALRLAAVHGQGLAMAPGFLFADDIKSGRLVPVLTEFLRTEYAVNAIYPHRHHVPAKVRTFIDLLAQRFRENPAWADPCRACLGAKADATPAIEAPPIRVDGMTADHLLPQR